MEKRWSIFSLNKRNTDGFVVEMVSAFETRETDEDWQLVGYWFSTFSVAGDPFIEYDDLTEEICLSWIPTDSMSLEDIENELLNPTPEEENVGIEYSVENNPFGDDEN